MRNIIFEVGANLGNDTQNFLASGSLVYAFEPTPELHLHLKNRFKNVSNYIPVPLAVDLENRWTTFNIAGSADWGCSSIHDFNPNIHQEWEGRPDFNVTDRCTVMTIRLDTFMQIYNIDKIDYLWIDAQGNDFRVLQSLGDRIKDVNKGRCEVANDVNLYSGVDNTVETVGNWLSSQGFQIEVIPHHHRKEADIMFQRV
jgi:FkbM family methyltransferase